ncbi:MAG: DUF4139 domain-containing protein, partial [candidate division WS1 bacterium]|nr:DUF4139 domain-containing protein [candidate division WS1 bacterium]
MRKLCAVWLVVLSLSWSVQAADLPLSRVVLFYSGVSYFEHQGQVEGNSSVNLSFRVEQINDILKSLVIQDLGGGTIAPVTYAPQDPLEHKLSAFSVDLGDNPSLASLLLRLRGAQVTVEGDQSATGTIVGVEQQEKAAGQTTVKFMALNLMTDKGLMNIALPGVRAIRLADAKLNAELQGALAAIASSRDVAKRELALGFQGSGKRSVRVGYLLETPVWKTTYRLVTGADGQLFLQGWALVDNTTDNDWNSVQMALVSGRPISFIQDLYQPVYAQRPEVPVSLPGVIRPQVHEGALAEEAEARRAEKAEAAPAPSAAPTLAARQAGLAGPAGPAGAFGGAGAADALRLAGAGVAAAATGAQVGELFQYAVSQPVTLPRQSSAMIPIVNQDLDGEKLSLYNERSHAVHPFNALRLKNNTGLHLMGGPITVFDGGAYAGDALIEDLNRGDERLITYALDLGVEVKTERPSVPQTLTSVKIDNGVLQAESRQQMTTVYTLKNRTEEPRTVMVEYPTVQDWKLIAPAKADEETRTLYRFKVSIPPGVAMPLTITLERPVREQIALVDWKQPDRIAFFLSSDVISPQVKAALDENGRRRVEIAGVV